MGNFKHFLDRLFSRIFKIVIFTGIAIGAYVLWNGWGNAALSDEQVKILDKETKVKMSKTDRKQGFSGIKTIYNSVDDELTGAQIDTEKGSNINRDKKTDE